MPYIVLLSSFCVVHLLLLNILVIASILGSSDQPITAEFIILKLKKMKQSYLDGLALNHQMIMK